MKVLITAGPTLERIDAIRFISNRSSGRMGYAVAEAARDAGCMVVLISGPVTLPVPQGIKVEKVESAAEMAAAVFKHAVDSDVIIMAAAVADYTPKNKSDRKLKKTPGDLTIELERTEDILLTLGNNKPEGQVLVGFAAETENLVKYATGKLQRKNLDWIAANDISASDRGFGADANEITLIGRSGQQINIPLADKKTVARRLLDIILPQ
ncbi:bifunctional phosphopantothenoylcysteine decarboxylase/phosphopantothenate--cysteine ligase CoaBC [Lentisphaerota bacterium ZTH]|nr:bifunctional phosphopantothenoylcysteine decarboxylase/phosphopantothenate--cysteine ligase CoaBC [Lentisphaerota bacterium]WET05513.1 bifunctional phosphopantothenoylcysteine decarboxylase/phosphopantothenate--cysteine ligase CoaBC [Lentisphaerota bacterium ZTH]